MLDNKTKSNIIITSPDVADPVGGATEPKGDPRVTTNMGAKDTY